MKQDIPLIGPILKLFIGTRNERFVRRYNERVNAINKLEPEMRKLSDAQLRGKLGEFRSRIDKGAKADDLLVEAFAVAREAMDRAVGIRNIFNPVHADQFDASKLSASGRALYDQIKAQVAATPPAEPVGEYQGCSEPVPGYIQVDIPVELYEEVRTICTESRPPFRARPFDVQLIGGMVLAQGKISEMKTGEGKTIVGPLACYLASVERTKVHVVTVNDYLVKRDRDWTFPYFHALGLRVGAIHPMHMQTEETKRRMYECDVVYGTTAEFGFDFLRDNMKRNVEQQVQRVRQFAIVDEVDSILIDEARTPLIISGPAHDDRPRYELADQLARHLVSKQGPWQRAEDACEQCRRRIKGIEGDLRGLRDTSKKPALLEELAKARAELPKLEQEKNKFTRYYEVMMERRAVYVTHEGIAEAQKQANIGSFYVDANMDVPHLLEQALKAHVVYERDRDYIVDMAENPNTGRVEPSVIIVDVNTGRKMVGRQWSDGLHQAVECKEAVPIKQENQTVATITIQNFFKMYKRLAGMTGTADTEAQEFHDIYKLDVVSIPTNRPVVRTDKDDMVFLSAKDKWSYIVDELKAFHDAGRPVLVGTTSVEKSETLSKMLTQRHGVKHEVLNAKQHDREAEIVKNAGQLGAVMISTNMAGRGTDIKLGTLTREQLLEHWLKRGIAPRELTVDATDQQVRELCYRKMAPSELGIPKREAEAEKFEDLELKLLRHWARKHTMVDDKTIDRAGAEDLRKALDKEGRFALHRLRWYTSVEDLGGLHVIGTERHESRRIDNQLRGRSGRQGDKGSTRFFISLEDELMRLFAGETMMKTLALLGMREGDAIEHPMLSRSVERAQRKVEERNFQGRKNILEYDEVMEHQRQGFYGLRQRVLEGRELRGLIFDYISDAVRDAAGEFLKTDYPARRASEFAQARLNVDIPASRLNGLDVHEMEVAIRNDAKQDMRGLIDRTLGEYVPDDTGEGPAVEFDAQGLAKWAKDRFGVELSESDLESMGSGVRQSVAEKLGDASDAVIDAADLSGLAGFFEADLGAADMSRWAKSKFDLDVAPGEIAKAAAEDTESVVKLMLKQAQDRYLKREIEYPVDYAMDVTKQMMGQGLAMAPVAMGYLVKWANTRYEVGWTADRVRTMGPMKIREQLIAASEKFVNSGELEKAVQAAVAQPNDDSLEKHLLERYEIEMPESMRRLKDQERADAIRAKVEGALRSELVYFERTLLLDILDDVWRNHLYEMDKLRDGINFRVYSQQDPRIEYKREGSRMFREMQQTIRDRVTDRIFKTYVRPSLSVMPMGMAGPAMMTPPAAAASAALGNRVPGPSANAPGNSPTPRPAGGGPAFGSMIT